MVVEFENCPAGYEEWAKRNRDGYVLNLKPDPHPAVLHRTKCSHVYPARPEYGDFTKKRKVCSSNREAVEAWAPQQGRSFVLCSSCDV